MRPLAFIALLLAAGPLLAGNLPAGERVSRAVTATLPPGLAVGQVRAPVLPAGEVSVEWRTEGPRAGWVDVLATVRSKGQPIGKGWARVELKPLRRVPVAARPLHAGDILSSQDVLFEQRPVSPAEGLRIAVAGLPGARVTREVGAGQVLVDGDVIRAAPLPFGTPVRVLVRHGAVTVSAGGTLERPARPGEPAVVRVAVGSRPVTGRLVDATTFVPESRRDAMSSRIVALALLGVAAAGCTEHISPYRAKHREFDTGDYDVAMRAAPGSLFSGRSHGLFENDRARNVGDVVEILVDEADSGSHDANSTLKTSNQASVDQSGLLDLLKKAAPSIDLKSLLGLASQSNFQGQGQIQKNGKLTAHLSVRVRKVLPNGDLYAEGTKVVMVGAEEHHVYISGVIRPQDIALDGTVSSGRVADAEIEFTGRGDINDTQRPGWLSRLFKKLWPF